MTKNISSKTGGQKTGQAKTEKKSQHQNLNITTNHSQTESSNAISAATVTAQKTSTHLKMLTPEQKRLASLMNDKVDVTEIEKKINKIMELTGATKDKAIVALHDCANELDKAIDMILEGDSINESEWKSQARKKKTKPGQIIIKDSNAQINGEAKKGQKSRGQTRSKYPDKQAQFRDKPERSAKKENWKSRDQTNNNNESSNKQDLESDNKLDEFPDETTAQSNQPLQRSRFSGKDENQFKPHNKYQNNREDRRSLNSDRPRSNYNRNSNQFGPGSERQRGTNDRMMDRRPYQNKNYNSKKAGYTNSIDTWSNSLTANDNTTPNTDYAQMTVGNWSDVVSSSNAASNVQQVKQNDLTEKDDWSKAPDNTNLIEQVSSKVFSTKENQNTSTSKSDDRLSKLPNLASIVSGVKPVQNVNIQPTQQHASSKQQHILSNSNNQSILNKSSLQQQRQSQQHTSQPSQNKIDLAALLKNSQQQQQSTNNLIRTNIQKQQRNSQPDANTNTFGAVILQRLQQRMNVNPEQDQSINKSGATNLNDYVNNSYNQNKNLVHNIPSNTYNSQQNTNLFDNQSHHLHHQNVADQKSLIEKKRRHTKIPESAVEMPTSEQISSLNVEFGALDFVSSATDSYGLNDDQIPNKSTQFNLNRENNNDKNSSTNLLSTVRGSQQPQSNENSKQSKDSLMQNIDHHSSHHQHQLQDNILQQQSTDSRKSQQSAAGYQLNNFSKQDSNQHSIYQPNLQNYSQSGYSAVNNYSSQNHNSSHNNSASANNQANQTSSSNQQQKINLKDIQDNSSSNQNQSNNSSTNTTSSSAIGNLVNSTTVTTNVLKNSLTATGNKTAAGMQQPLNVAAPLLGTPQYIMNMSQPGLSTAFYPVYDMPAMAADHSFRYQNQNTQDVKYNRPDAQDGQVPQSNHNNAVQSTQQVPVTQTPNHQIFSQFPPYFFYTGVNMMTQGLYQTPFLPVQPNPGPSGNQHANNTNQAHSTGFPKGAQPNPPPYSTSYASSTGYDQMTGQLTQTQDYNKQQQNYNNGPNSANQNQQQTAKQMSTSGSNDLVNNSMYTKSHAQLAKNLDKPSATFQTGTPPPFGIVTLGYNPNQFIPMIQPQSNPSMLHHSLGDANALIHQCLQQ